LKGERKMKKLQSAILIALILSSTFTFLSYSLPAVRADSNAPTVLEFNTLDNLEIEQGEDTVLMNLKHYVNIPASPLADIYRQALGASDYSVEEEMPIPEKVTVIPKIAIGQNLENASENIVPVRKQFYEALYQEYDSSLGLDTLIVNSSMVPKGDSGECRIYADAMAFPRILTTIPGSAGDTWVLGIGPTNSARFAEYIFTQMTFLKMLLQQVPGEQEYRSSYSIRISFPDYATILNLDEISGLSWLVDLGGGNTLDASLSVAESLMLNETMIVTEQNTTMPMADLCSAFEGYKSFRIEYSILENDEAGLSGLAPDSLSQVSAADVAAFATISTVSGSAVASEGDFSWSYLLTLIDNSVSGDIPLPPDVPPGSYAKYDGHLKLGAEFSISWEPTLPIFGLRSFKSSIRTDAEFEFKVEAGITEDYNKDDLTLEIWDVTYPIKFFIGPVPVDVNLILGVEGRLTIDFKAEMTITTGYVATGWLEAGVEYNPDTNQVQPFQERGLTSEFLPPTEEVSASLEIRPSLAFDVWAQFYEIAGPQLEFELYLSATATLTQSNTFELNIAIGLQISVSFRFADYLEELLSLEDYGPVVIFDKVLWEYQWKPHHDVAITNVELPKAKVFPGDNIDISVNVKNQGYTINHDKESFDVNVFYNDLLIDTRSVSDLAEGTQITLNFAWNTANAAIGKHMLKAELSDIIPSEESDGNDYSENNVFETEVEISPTDFYITCSPEKTWYKPGEATVTTVSVKNLRNTRTTFWVGASFKDATEESVKYDPQISTAPQSATLDPYQTATFTVSWTIPNDAPFEGLYQIAFNCWKDNNFKDKFNDNIEWADVFYVYKLQILWPIASSPASAGDSENPNAISVSVRWIPNGLGQLLHKDTMFSVRIDNQPATFESKLINFLFSWIGSYELKVYPPAHLSQGFHDLTITATLDQLMDSETALGAIEYVTGPPTEPIQKGLTWLRTAQYPDGSWGSSVGVTSMAALAFLNAGYDESDTTVSKAISYVLSRVHSDGSIYSSYPVYETSIAILSLVATHNTGYSTILEKAKNWLERAQQDEDFGYTSANYQYGGWTYYSTRGDPDLSNTQFALLALDAANLPKADPTWSKAVIFVQRCQNRPMSNDQAWAHYSSQPSYNDGGFIYRPWGWSLAGGTLSYGSMTGAGIWGLLLSGVSRTDARVTAAMNWVKDHYTWATNPVYGSRPFYYYLSMSKALTMYGERTIDGHDWYQDLYDKIVSMQINAGSNQGYWSSPAEDYNPVLTTIYAILSLQTRAIAPPVQRLSYLTFILRSNCLLRIIDPDGNLVGYNYVTALGENNIPTAIYSGPNSEPQYVIIINPKPGNYKLELVGVSEGLYTLSIQGNYGEEVTKAFEYTSEIGIAELQGSQVTVTAIVGPIDVYTNPPEFEKIIDNIAPTTTLTIGSPQYTDGSGERYITSGTSLTLTAEDNAGGTGVASTHYRVYNTSGYDTGLITSIASIEFHLTGINDGEYSIDFYSVDNIGNIEDISTQKIILDNTAPSLTIEIPSQYAALQDGVNFTVSAWDLSSVASVTFSIQCPQGNTISPEFQLMHGTLKSDGKWHLYFDTRRLSDGFYMLVVNGTDVLGNSGITTVPFSIRNWATIQLLPSTPNSKAGRTMPIKFSIRVKASVDPAQPFIYNEELTIKIYKKGSPGTILQTSTYGTTSRDYRIDSVSGLYITNFKTSTTPTTYVVEIYRKDLQIGTFQFSTVK
jgi:squalene-hopene/tetraprenyl-beta-curcumene cyclase